MPEEFGLLTYVGPDLFLTTNLGDEIQSIAARGFLPRVDHFVPREALNSFASKEPVKLVLNGWFCHRPELWPPAAIIDPLLISFHVTAERGFVSNLRAREEFAHPDIRDYLKHHGPVGARDISTLDYLRSLGIDAYFSGCLTLTLERPPGPRERDLLVLCDVSPEMTALARKRFRGKIIETTHVDASTKDSSTRFRTARSLLDLYARAACVVTTRLHCCLPCLAFNTPVLLVETNLDSYRFDGLRELAHHCTPPDFQSKLNRYDLNAPPENPNAYEELRRELIRNVNKFVSSRRSNL